jgi:hypothetical protein
MMTRLLATGVAKFGVYRLHPRPTVGVLSDIRILGRNILTAASAHRLDKFIPADLASEYIAAVRPNGIEVRGRASSRLRQWANGPPVVRAAAITAALQVLQSRDLQSAAAPLAMLPSDVSRYDLHRAALSDRRGAQRASPVLRAIQLTAMDSQLGPADQLHCRLGTQFPQWPLNDRDRRDRLQRSTPSMLWPAWTLRICPPSFYQLSARCVLAAAVQMVFTTIDADEAAAMLGNAVAPSNVAFLLWRLKASPYWDDIRAALIRVADHLDRNGAPIDYERRRHLDYTNLLPDAEWISLCRSVGKQPQGLSTARRHLRQRISGVPNVATANERLDGNTSHALSEFPRRLTPQLADGLDAYAVEFLALQGITDEPVVWEPTIDLIGPLQLPGCAIDDVDLTELHRLIRVEQLSTPAVARRLQASTHLIRLALDEYPAPMKPPAPREPRIGPQRPGRVYQHAVNALPPQRLRELHLDERMSLRRIADLAEVSRGTVSKLARDYGIAVRRSGGQPRQSVDPAWLRTEHVIKHRSFAELGRELKMSSETLAALAKEHGIPVRTVARHSRAELIANDNVPAILVPALEGHGGWERLQRFAVIAHHPTLTAGGKELGVTVSSVEALKNRLEKDFGQQLMHVQPVRLTAFGERVFVAVTKLDDFGGP